MPKITLITIENYRGFYDARNISPAQPNGNMGSGLTVLVGPNNSGKTSALNAFRLVLVPRQVDLEHRHEGKMLSISLTNDAGQTKSVSNPDLGASLVPAGDQNAWPKADDFRIVPSRRSWAPYTGTQKVEQGQYWQNYFTRDTREIEDPLFVSRIAGMSTDDRTKFDELLKKLLPQLNTWRIELSRGQTYILYETKSGARHAADLFGDGMSSLFRVALALFDSREGYVVAIDEPELSLHPQAQKSLADVLSQFSRDRQIIITTHSPYFVNWSDISSGAKIFRLTQEVGGVRVGCLKNSTVSDIERLIADWQKPNLLDAVSREVFFADEVLFLEGQEDVGLLRKFTEEKGLEALPAFGYGAGGAANIRFFLRMAEDLGIPAAAIFDGDHAEMKLEVEREFPNSLVELLSAPDIRDKPRRDNRNRETDEVEKEGIFDRRGVIKPQYEEGLVNLLARISAFLTERA